MKSLQYLSESFSTVKNVKVICFESVWQRQRLVTERKAIWIAQVKGKSQFQIYTFLALYIAPNMLDSNIQKYMKIKS